MAKNEVVDGSENLIVAAQTPRPRDRGSSPKAAAHVGILSFFSDFFFCIYILSQFFFLAETNWLGSFIFSRDQTFRTTSSTRADGTNTEDTDLIFFYAIPSQEYRASTPRTDPNSQDTWRQTEKSKKIDLIRGEEEQIAEPNGGLDDN